ncbi:SCO6745 family protein [Streptomyces poriticola]|uniref:SCO6745 family protein n=1 Tax=Streptomyces poriticola TaxID=3120506 RepID=UPI002FCE5818
MSHLAGQDLRHCQNLLNILHCVVYFSPDFDEKLSRRGVDDPIGRYLAGRAAALGPVGPGVVTATFYSFRHETIARHLPAVWERLSPEEARAARLEAADSTLRRLLGEEAVGSLRLKEAAALALGAAGAGERSGRPLYAAHADHPVPPQPHLTLWHAATLLREHRGDSHVAALSAARLDGLEALISHSAGDDGMPREAEMAKRGWTAEDGAAAEDRLRRRGLMTADGALTERGRRMRLALEEDTDQRDRAPYEHLGADGVAELTALTAGLVRSIGTSGLFPDGLAALFLATAGD